MSNKVNDQNVAEEGYQKLHKLLKSRSSSMEDALMMVEKHPAALRHKEKSDGLLLHIECKYQCRSPIIAKCIELYPESLSVADKTGYLPLHKLLGNKVSAAEDVLMMIDAYPAALQQQGNYGQLPIHLECEHQCRSSVLTKCLELHAEGLAIADKDGYLPLHRLLENKSASMHDVLMMIDAYPAALQYQNKDGYLPLHIECIYYCRSSILAKCMELYPEGASVSDESYYSPMQRMLENTLSSMKDALMMIEAHPAALKHQNIGRYLPIHIECRCRSRSSIIAKCIDLYPEGLAVVDEHDYLPLHRLLDNRWSSVEDALMMIDAYPAALKHLGSLRYRPIHIECKYNCRTSILAKCMELYPEALDDTAISFIVQNLKRNNNNIRLYSSVLSMVFAARPMCLYAFNDSFIDDIRRIPCHRRKILNLLPRHVFSQMHETDYADLNWQPRSAMLQLLSQHK